MKSYHIEWNQIWNAQFVYGYEYDGIICESECCGKYINLWLAPLLLIKKI